MTAKNLLDMHLKSLDQYLLNNFQMILFIYKISISLRILICNVHIILCPSSLFQSTALKTNPRSVGHDLWYWFHDLQYEENKWTRCSVRNNDLWNCCNLYTTVVIFARVTHFCYYGLNCVSFHLIHYFKYHLPRKKKSVSLSINSFLANK